MSSFNSITEAQAIQDWGSVDEAMAGNPNYHLAGKWDDQMEAEMAEMESLAYEAGREGLDPAYTDMPGAPTGQAEVEVEMRREEEQTRMFGRGETIWMNTKGSKVPITQTAPDPVTIEIPESVKNTLGGLGQVIKGRLIDPMIDASRAMGRIQEEERQSKIKETYNYMINDLGIHSGYFNEAKYRRYMADPGFDPGMLTPQLPSAYYRAMGGRGHAETKFLKGQDLHQGLSRTTKDKIIRERAKWTYKNFVQSGQIAQKWFKSNVPLKYAPNVKRQLTYTYYTGKKLWNPNTATYYKEAHQVKKWLYGEKAHNYVAKKGESLGGLIRTI